MLSRTVCDMFWADLQKEEGGEVRETHKNVLISDEINRCNAACGSIELVITITDDGDVS